MNIALTALAFLSLSSSSIWVRFADAPNEAIGTLRLFGAAAFLLLWQLSQKTSPLRIFQEMNRSAKNWTFIASFVFFVHLWTFVAATQNTSIAHLVMIFSANPIFVALGAYLFFGEKLPKRALISYPLTMIGLTLLMVDRAPEGTVTTVYGDVMALASVILHAGYGLLSKRARNFLDNDLYSFWLYVGTGGFYFLFALIRGVFWTSESGFVEYPMMFYFSVLGLIVFPTLLGHTLFTYLLKHMNITILSCAKLVEPGISVYMAYFFFGERAGPHATLAFSFIAAAVLILFLPKENPKLPVGFRETES